MAVLDAVGNTSVESNATDNAAIFIKTNGKTAKIENLVYAQSKTRTTSGVEENSGWIPIGAEAREGKVTLAIKMTPYPNTSYSEYPSYQAIDYDPITGAYVGIHALGGRYFTRDELIRLEKAGRGYEVTSIAYFGDDSEVEFLNRFDWVLNPSSQAATNRDTAEQPTLEAPATYGAATAEIITNYNPKGSNPIKISIASFSGSPGTLKTAKKTKQLTKLAEKQIDFIYDQQAGYLYFNENGSQPGFGAGGVFAILEGKPKMGASNFEFV
jgi:hypothetical protein